MSSAELTLIAADGNELILPGSARKKENSILHWTKLYWETKVDGSPDGTMRAKKADLGLFLSYFGEVLGSDHVDYWTPSITKNFRNWLEKTNPRKPKRRYQKAYAPTSINRTLATLRHFAKHIADQRPFESGSPFDEVEDLLIEEPEWNGLSDIERTRLAAALDQLTKLDTRANQMPRRNRAVFILALNTGLRANEISTLDFSQYENGYLRKVKGKGRTYADVYVNKETQNELDAYIRMERGTEPGPLFLTNRGGRMIRQQIDRFLRRVMNHANSKVPEGEEITLHAHKLRHTFTKKIYEEKGPIAAQKHGRHQSLKQLARYAAETREEREETADNLWS